MYARACAVSGYLSNTRLALRCRRQSEIRNFSILCRRESADSAESAEDVQTEDRALKRRCMRARARVPNGEALLVRWSSVARPSFIHIGRRSRRRTSKGAHAIRRTARAPSSSARKSARAQPVVFVKLPRALANGAERIQRCVRTKAQHAELHGAARQSVKLGELYRAHPL